MDKVESLMGLGLLWQGIPKLKYSLIFLSLVLDYERVESIKGCLFKRHRGYRIVVNEMRKREGDILMSNFTAALVLLSKGRPGDEDEQILI